MFFLARQAKKDLGWNYAWTQDGVIKMRRVEGEMEVEIESGAAIEALRAQYTAPGEGWGSL